MDRTQKDRLKDVLYSKVPEDGRSIGNVSLQQLLRDSQMKFSEPEYWEVRQTLIDEGRLEVGRGRGGSVHRVLLDGDGIAPEGPKLTAETHLYEPFHQSIVEYAKKNFKVDAHVSDITAFQGAKFTGGRWTRPDVTLIAVRTFEYLPQKTIEIMTFEVKPLNAYGVEGVYETAAHSAFANRSYLCLHVPTEGFEPPERVISECERFGVGLILFTNARDWQTFEKRVNARHNTPDPFEVDTFIGLQMQRESQTKLHKLLR